MCVMKIQILMWMCDVFYCGLFQQTTRSIKQSPIVYNVGDKCIIFVTKSQNREPPYKYTKHTYVQ